MQYFSAILSVDSRLHHTSALRVETVNRMPVSQTVVHTVSPTFEFNSTTYGGEIAMESPSTGIDEGDV